MDRTADTIGLSIMRRLTDIWSSAKSDSLIEYTGVTRVEPICIVDADLVHYQDIHEVMQSMQSIFSGYYLQAMLISVNVGRIDVFRHLDKLNPNRSPSASAADSAAWMMSLENYKHRLPSLEADRQPPSEAVVPNQAMATVGELANLSVGKMLHVNVSDNGHSATIPVAIRLIASSIPSQQIVHILSVGNKDTSMKERIRGWKSGRLEFWRDIVMAQDRIDAHKEALLKDKSGIYSQILERRSKNKLATLLSANPSVATASNLCVMSTETLQALEGEAGVKFNDFKSREKIFKETYMMIIAVVDKSWDRVTFYHRGIDGKTEVSLKDIKVSNKGNGPDIGEILKAYSLGASPSL